MTNQEHFETLENEFEKKFAGQSFTPDEIYQRVMPLAFDFIKEMLRECCASLDPSKKYDFAEFDAAMEDWYLQERK